LSGHALILQFKRKSLAIRLIYRLIHALWKTTDWPFGQFI